MAELVHNEWPKHAREIVPEYIGAFVALINELEHEGVERIVDHIRQARVRGSMVFLAGNGGSASTASHWVNDLGKATKRGGGQPIRVMALNDNVAWLTALANDEGYERAFAGQLENFGESGDVLIVISASGNSPNLVRAVELANERQLVTIGLLGFDGGVLKDLVTDCLCVTTEKGAYGLVESVHSVVCDLITTCLAEEIDPR